ncbi:hypothetical protein BDY19DRAFT_1059805 [Irpex rosettiformis]|uniref:Uncharacterized protein n=1 Tax=Irpex rosettiformis TaxID=378272 RepID=A0ACB8TTK4_9APHY|nr:hypothetical protein BDY19DRAFT_1059805 [Irpex rosettiformis]
MSSNTDNTVQAAVAPVDGNQSIGTTQHEADRQNQSKVAKEARFSPVPEHPPVLQRVLGKKGGAKDSKPKSGASQATGSGSRLPPVAEFVQDSPSGVAEMAGPLNDVQPLSTAAASSGLQEVEAEPMDTAEQTSWVSSPPYPHRMASLVFTVITSDERLGKCELLTKYFILFDRWNTFQADQVEEEDGSGAQSGIWRELDRHLNAGGNVESFVDSELSLYTRREREEFVESQCRDAFDYIPTMEFEMMKYSTKLHIKRYALSVGVEKWRDLCHSVSNMASVMEASTREAFPNIVSKNFVVGSQRAKDAFRDEAIDMVAYLKRIHQQGVDASAHLRLVGQTLNTFRQESSSVPSDEAIDTVAYLKRIHQQGVDASAHLRLVGQTLNTFRQETSSVPSYARATHASSAKVVNSAPAPARQQSVPMDTSDGPAPAGPSKTKSVRVVSPAPSPSPAPESVPVATAKRQRKKKKIGVPTPPPPPKPRPSSGWLARSGHAKTVAAQPKATKAQAEVEEIASPAVQQERQGASNKRARSRSPGSSTRPNTPSTLPPAAKKAKAQPASSSTQFDLEDLQCGYANIDMDLLKLIPDNLREEAVKAQGRRIREARLGAAPTPSSSTPSSSKTTKSAPPANASGAGQGGGAGSSSAAAQTPGQPPKKNKGNAPFKGAPVHHARAPFDKGALVVVLFDRDVVPLGRHETSVLNDKVTASLRQWEKLDARKNKQVSLDQALNQCVHSEWAGTTSVNLSLRFVYRVSDEFLTWLESTLWNWHESCPKGELSAEDQELQDAFCDSYPVHARAYRSMPALFEDGKAVLPCVTRVWHYKPLIRLQLIRVPCHVKEDGHPHPRMVGNGPSRSLLSVYDEMLPQLSADVAPLIVPFGSTPKAVWVPTTHKAQSHGTVNCYAYEMDKAVLSLLQKVKLVLGGGASNFELAPAEKNGVAVCGICHRAGHYSHSCGNRDEVFCAKCVGPHKTEEHNAYCVCCLAERYEKGSTIICPESHWVCCNCDETGHSATDVKKCRFLRHLNDRKYLMSHFKKCYAEISVRVGKKAFARVYNEATKSMVRALDKSNSLTSEERQELCNHAWRVGNPHPTRMGYLNRRDYVNRTHETTEAKEKRKRRVAETMDTGDEGAPAARQATPGPSVQVEEAIIIPSTFPTSEQDVVMTPTKKGKGRASSAVNFNRFRELAEDPIATSDGDDESEAARGT